MATTFKALINEDIANTRTLLHENVPITGSLVSGTYYEPVADECSNIKNYSHTYFQSVYDYGASSASANHIMDLTFGYSPIGCSSSYSITYAHNSNPANTIKLSNYQKFN